MNSSYTMLHDPNTLSFVRAIDSTGSLQIPRQIGNTQTTSAGVTLDIPTLLRLPTSMFGTTRSVLQAFQPIDISLERNVLTDYEGTTVAPPISYQLGLGGIGQFRHLGGESATSAGVNTQFTISNSITLPFGATLSNRYQRITLRNWTQIVDDTNAIGDATQLIFPDIGIRWNVRITSRDALLSSFSTSARIVGTRQLLSSPGESGLASGDNGETRMRNYPISMTAIWAGSRPLTTTLGVNFTQRVDNQPGLAGSGSSMNLTADISRAFALPADWHSRSDVRARLSFEDSHGQSYVLNPMAVGLQSQLSNNGRRATTLTTDTDVTESLSSSLVISRVANFDNNLNRLFAQTVVSAVFHMQFYAGEMK